MGCLPHRDFPGGPVAKTWPSSARGAGLTPGRGAKIPHASQPTNRNIKQKQYCNKFNKHFAEFFIKKILKKKKRRKRKVRRRHGKETPKLQKKEEDLSQDLTGGNLPRQNPAGRAEASR